MRLTIVFFLLFLPFLALTQELPPVINFSPNQYEAGNQNWMISQAPNKNIYVANSTGLLEYSGSEWNLYPMPNNSIVRSVKVVGGRVYTGAYMEIGYWTKNEKGLLKYTSLLPNFSDELKDGEQFWHMEYIGNILVFQSFEGLYLHYTTTGEIIKVNTPADAITNLFEGENTIYFQVAGKGLFTVQNNLALNVIPADFLTDIELMHVTQEGKELQLISRNGNFYEWDGENLIQNKNDLSEKIKNRSIFKAITLEDNSLILGTVEDGIYYINEEGEIVLHFNQENGLANNTVLELFKDENGNIWAGLDNGISIINLDSPYKLYPDNYGNLGSVYASLQLNDYLYLGTNQGLFYKKVGENGFQFIEGTNGQVWSLQVIDGILFCGHNKGTYIINDQTAARIFDSSGTWIVKKYENHPGFYLQGHYNGLSLLQEKDGIFNWMGMLEDFPHSSKFIISEPEGDIWVGNEHKGVFKLKLEESGTTVSSIDNYTFGKISGITSSIFKFNDTIYYSAKEKLFQYHEEEGEFKAESRLGKIFEGVELISGKIVNTGNNKIWGFATNTIFNVETAQLSARYKLNSIYLTEELRNITLGYENINELGNDSYLLGVSSGYFKFEDMPRNDNSNYVIRIDKVSTSALDEVPEIVGLGSPPIFHYKTNNINFDFSIPEYKKFLNPVFSYRLLGLSPNWSIGAGTPSANFKNLPFGEYEFQVKATLGNQDISPVSFKFEVDRPWYFSYTAIFLYFILSLIIIFVVNIAYKKKHRRLLNENEKELRMKNLEAGKKIVELQNQQLERDMATKNKELAVSTMSLIKKNEFLTSIKEKLKHSADSNEVNYVIKTIDKDINEEDNWNFFKEAFNNADKDFFKKIKSKHPNLTSNDLKLCAYLRLNLSSKEIAPLLNISVKSVEIKRYRLRKKMDLPRDVNLSNHILEV